MLLTKEEYLNLTENWKKYGVIYQRYDHYLVRFPILLKHIDLFKDKDVLEVGTNAGLAAYHISKVARSYVGVECANDYWKQSQETRKHIENENVKLFNCSIKSFIKRSIRGDIKAQFNACYMAYVFYHFDDKEVKMFFDYVLPKLDVIIIQTRNATSETKGQKKHNSFKLWEPQSVKDYLESAGLTTTLEWGPNNKFHFIIGTRKKESGVEFAKKVENGMIEADAQAHKIIDEVINKQVVINEPVDVVTKPKRKRRVPNARPRSR